MLIYKWWLADGIGHHCAATVTSSAIVLAALVVAFRWVPTL